MAAGGLAKRIEYKIFNKHASADKNSANIVCINGVCGPGYSGCGCGTKTKASPGMRDD